MNRRVTYAGSLSSGLLSASLAFATPSLAAPITYSGFSAADCGSTLTCVGSSSVVGSVLRVTPANYGQAGAAYSTTPITLGSNATFSTTFQFRFTSPGGVDPADGIVFVLSSQSAGLGGAGNGIGYSGSSPQSVGIEFDTFNNDGNGYNNGGGGNVSDLSSNHVAIDVGGVLTNTQTTNPYGVSNCTIAGGYTNTTGTNTYTQPGCMSNGDVWSVTIGYDGSTNLLSIAIQDGSASVDDIITDFPINLATQLGGNAAYVGFTSGTGSGYENHDILDWSFASDLTLVPPPTPPTPPTTPTGVPEPMSLALLGIGAVGLVTIRRRRCSVIRDAGGPSEVDRRGTRTSGSARL